MELAKHILIRIAVSSFVLWALLTASGFVANAAETVLLPPDGGRPAAADLGVPAATTPLPPERPASPLGVVPVPADKPAALSPLDVIRSYHRDRAPGSAGAAPSLRISHNDVPMWSSLSLDNDQINFPLFGNLRSRYLILLGA